METEKLYTIKEAALASGYCTQYLTKLCREKSVAHTRRGKRYLFTAAEVARLTVHVDVAAEVKNDESSPR